MASLETDPESILFGESTKTPLVSIFKVKCGSTIQGSCILINSRTVWVTKVGRNAFQLIPFGTHKNVGGKSKVRHWKKSITHEESGAPLGTYLPTISTGPTTPLQLLLDYDHQV